MPSRRASAAQGLHRAGTIDKATMRDFDESCRTAASVIAAEKINRIRERRMSVNLYSRYLSTDESTVRNQRLAAQWHGAQVADRR